VADDQRDRVGEMRIEAAREPLVERDRGASEPGTWREVGKIRRDDPQLSAGERF